MICGHRRRPPAALVSTTTNGHPAPGELEQLVPVAVPPVRSATTWQRWRGLLLYAAIWLAFIILRNYGDRTPLAQAVTAADASLERQLFGGELPTARLQRQLATPEHPRWYDFVATSFEWSFFVVPHIWRSFSGDAIPTGSARLSGQPHCYSVLGCCSTI